MRDNALKVEAKVEPEKGRWAVYLEVTFWQNEGESPLEVRRHRIQDYPTLAQAEVAGRWMARGADRF